jgi:mono/diheme cytochrome c family protein
MTLPRLWWQYLSLLLLVSPPSLSVWGADASVDYNRDIRPLLSDKCYACHGPDEAHREGGFRLDQQDSAFGEADSGEHPLVAGDPDTSELYQRIATDDSSMRMPPEDASNPLSPDEIGLIRSWIEQGAPWQRHWSLVAPTRPELPAVADQAWPRGAIDHFVLARLEAEGLTPAAQADRQTLIRRVTFDLTGLPPTLEEVDAFLANDSSTAYEELVDRLLAKPAYGEHMARFWLDAARYGDTHGLHLDNYREMWPYRDWVVSAFNDNMPFDQFTIEQLAGDLLPDPTEEQLIATGFNRCHVTTNEGGSIAEEVYVRNVVDRVVTTGTVFMGATFDCTRCHDHKYDPLTMKDFYATFAFFNSLDGNPMDGNKKDPAPVLRVLTDDQKSEIAALEEMVEGLQAKIVEQLAAYQYVEPAEPIVTKLAEPQEIVWVEDAVPAGAKEEGGWKFVKEPVFSGEKASTRTATGLSQHFFTGAKEPLRVAQGDVLFAYVYLAPENPPQEVMLQWNDGSWDHRAYWGGNEIDWGQDGTASRRHLGDLPAPGEWARLDIPAAEVGLKPGAQINGWAFTQFDGTVYWDKAGIVTKAEQQPIYDSLVVWQRDQQAAAGGSLPDDVKSIIALEDEKRTEAQRKRLRDYFVEHVHVGTRDVFDPLHKAIDEANASIAKIENNAATTLVFRERKEPKPAYVLNRGEYDQQREQVDRATPAAMPPMPDGAPLNRLGFAQWLVDPSHPRTARVAVNRFWQQAFGTGIVKTAEDFGSQGEMPSHPRLLDWLAVEFRESGWDVKHLMKLIVMSATYQQDSTMTPELVARDPRNRLLARGPRFRLDAEMLRDQALAVSGLLVDQQGGPSVKPPQPDGLWFAVGYSGSNTVRFKADQGPGKVHRRKPYC